MNSWPHRWTTTHLTGRPSSTSKVDLGMTPKRMVATYLIWGYSTSYFRKGLITYVLDRTCLKWDETSFTKGTYVSRTTPNLTWDLGLTHIGWPYTSSMRGDNVVYKEHGTSEEVRNQPCESTGLTEIHARMTKTQLIWHLKGKTTNQPYFIPDNVCAIPETCLHGHS